MIIRSKKIQGCQLFILLMIIGLLTSTCGVVEKLANRPPQIKQVSAEQYFAMVGDTVTVSVEASDPDKDELTYSWNATGGHFISSQGEVVRWIAPKIEGIYDVEVAVRDKNGGESVEKVSISVMSESKPSVRITQPKDGEYITALGSVEVQVDASPIAFIDRVEFYVDGKILSADKFPPYAQSWTVTNLSGPKKLKAVAWRVGSSSIRGADSVNVILQGVIPIPR